MIRTKMGLQRSLPDILLYTDRLTFHRAEHKKPAELIYTVKALREALYIVLLSSQQF